MAGPLRWAIETVHGLGFISFYSNFQKMRSLLSTVVIQYIVQIYNKKATLIITENRISY